MTKLRFVKCHNSAFFIKLIFLPFTWMYAYGGKASAFLNAGQNVIKWDIAPSSRHETCLHVLNMGIQMNLQQNQA